MTIEKPKRKSEYAKQLEGDSKPTPIVRKKKIHSELTALPLLMVIIGVIYYTLGEKRQAESELVMSESSQHDVVVDGLSVLKSVSGKGGKYYFWFQLDGDKRGARVSEADSEYLEHLTTGQQVIVSIAPTVPGSHVKWLYQVHHEGVDLLPARPASP